VLSQCWLSSFRYNSDLDSVYQPANGMHAGTGHEPLSALRYCADASSFVPDSVRYGTGRPAHGFSQYLMVVFSIPSHPLDRHNRKWLLHDVKT
jgi:hypothetical protein